MCKMIIKIYMQTNIIFFTIGIVAYFLTYLIYCKIYVERKKMEQE